MYVDSNQIGQVLQAIKEKDGLMGPLQDKVRAYLLGYGLATVEVSPVSGLDFQWTLTAEGKKKLREFNATKRYNKKVAEGRVRWRPSNIQRDAVVPLTIEVLDALKSIRETGDPGTDKMDILARIQRHGSHAAKTVKGAEGKDTLISGSLAEYKDGVWTLTNAGFQAQSGHIRKDECAQFTGKVR